MFHLTLKWKKKRKYSTNTKKKTQSMQISEQCCVVGYKADNRNICKHFSHTQCTWSLKDGWYVIFEHSISSYYPIHISSSSTEHDVAVEWKIRFKNVWNECGNNR